MQTTLSRPNGINLDTLNDLVASVSASAANAVAGFKATTRWVAGGGTRSETEISSWSLGGKARARDFRIASDEPPELCGKNTAPNPQELLMAALNACMTVGYVAGCAVQGIELDALEIQTEGTLDIRGFLALDPTVKPGYEELRISVRVKGSGTPEQFRAIHEHVMKTSPNFYNLTRPVPVKASLRVG